MDVLSGYNIKSIEDRRRVPRLHYVHRRLSIPLLYARHQLSIQRIHFGVRGYNSLIATEDAYYVMLHIKLWCSCGTVCTNRSVAITSKPGQQGAVQGSITRTVSTVLKYQFK